MGVQNPYQKWDKNKVQGRRKNGAVSQTVWRVFAGGERGPCVECMGNPDAATEEVTREIYLKIL